MTVLGYVFNDPPWYTQIYVNIFISIVLYVLINFIAVIRIFRMPKRRLWCASLSSVTNSKCSCFWIPLPTYNLYFLSLSLFLSRNSPAFFMADWYSLLKVDRCKYFLRKWAIKRINNKTSKSTHAKFTNKTSVVTKTDIEKQEACAAWTNQITGSFKTLYTAEFAWISDSGQTVPEITEADLIPLTSQRKTRKTEKWR